MSTEEIKSEAPVVEAKIAETEHEVSELVVEGMTLDEKYELARSVGQECNKEEELRLLLEKKPSPVCYDGFEPSGRMHIAQGLMKAINVNKLTDCGCTFKFWVADWFAMLNNKMGGDLKKIRKLGEYFIEVWRACGMNMDKVEFLWTSEEISKDPAGYWGRVMDIATKFNIPRMKRCCTIMGRKEGEELSVAQLLYPCMQCADIFYLKADICQLGMDQRKVNMLAREYCDLVKPRIKHKPVILSHEMLAGLKEGQAKMSKSDPDSAIFMEDTTADVNRKIKKAYCPPGVAEGNPCLGYCRLLVFPKFGEFTINRKEENGGDVTYTDFKVLEADFVEGKLHPGDLKPALSKAINKMLEPVRAHFSKGAPKKLLGTIKKYKVTR
eukprot:TRINITY_DN782164_c0_g1_i1.p1 TRINITY_DN782164_c0_g1~~TRINITY_DN782164_c0_g1_i1.p1  ORF type:complete len:382 (+),score=124.88 TRINITY_DN782164_c0_g1_i1:129-1274(+)